MRKLTITVAAAALLALPALADAQASESVLAQATVLSPITVTADANLVFGEVLPGVPSTVAPADAGAGAFEITGADTEEVSLSFGTLPAVLDHTGASTATLPLSFGAGSAGFGTGGTISTTFDPGASQTVTLDGTPLSVFIGGTVSPAVTQEAGAYENTITLSVAYTGS
jgi:hypothetical protein